MGRLPKWPLRRLSIDPVSATLGVGGERNPQQRRAELRKLVVALVVLVVVAGAVFVADHVAIHWTERRVASHIEHSFPGSHATVTISSSLYLPRLAVSGTVQDVHAHVTDVTDGRLHLATVDVTAHSLKVNRTDLLHNQTRVESLSTATITATFTVAEALRAAGHSAEADMSGLASGVKANVQAGAGLVHIEVGPLSFTFSYNSLVPCVGSGQVSGGEIILTCTTHTVPAALQ
jgi:LmeA-like phospholipid-binding